MNSLKFKKNLPRSNTVSQISQFSIELENAADLGDYNEPSYWMCGEEECKENSPSSTESLYRPGMKSESEEQESLFGSALSKCAK